jgi:acyl-CoA synthetase (AMP-forming)/AMP-acid ligase II
MPPAEYAAENGSRDIGTTVPLPDGAPGEICVRGENVSPGYLGAASGGLPRRAEWLCTGDEGVRNADGTITFLGLLKPMFTRNGFNVYPRELERVIAGLSGVREVEVSAIPEPAKENDIRVRVRGSVSEADVREWCEARLSAYKQPTVVEIVA